MSDHVVTVLHGLYRGEFRLRHDKTHHRTWFMEPFDVAIQRLDKATTPIAFELARENGNVLWREHEGRMLRELQSHDNKSMGHWKFERGNAAPALTGHLAAMRDHPDFLDQHFLSPLDLGLGHAISREGFEPGAEPIHFPGKTFWKWIRDERETARRRAEENASRMAVIDGTLYREAAPPVIAVRFARNGDRLFIKVEPAIVEMEAGDAVLAYFPFDRADAALEFADAIISGKHFDLLGERFLVDATDRLNVHRHVEADCQEAIDVADLKAILRIVVSPVRYNDQRHFSFDAVYAAALLSLTPPMAGTPVFTPSEALATIERIAGMTDVSSSVVNFVARRRLANDLTAKAIVESDTSLSDLVL